MATTARQLIPLKPVVFEILAALGDDERHGWSLVREIQARLGGARIMPANFYRTLRGMLADGLIEETAVRSGRDEDGRRRYFRVTPIGREAARLEARRLCDLVADARTRRLLSRKP